MHKAAIKVVGVAVLGIVALSQFAHAEFVHPGITHKLSDLDRMKYMVESKIDPWYSSYEEMASDSKASYNYEVQGDPSFTELGRNSGVNYAAWNSDIRAAYYNAIQWYITGDSRYADKAVEIFNAWTNLTSVTSSGTDSLSGGIGYIMIEAAEIIKSTYDGWSDDDIQNFKDMLVYPGYSTTSEPSGDTTFYWMSYQGDPIRHGNQGLSGLRTVMAMGIFLDNEIMYDRALRYIEGKTHRSDDLAYPSGPNTSDEIISSTDYADTYSVTRGYTIEDYGYNEVMTNYIWETGQCQESSRDQQHVFFGLGLLCSMSEMAWNQGDDLYSYADDRLLMGLEYTMKYNVSYLQSFADQSSWWEPTVDSGEFSEGFDRTGRWYSKAISPDGVGGFPYYRPIFEMPVAHYIGRGLKSADEAIWITRARDYAIEEEGYETAGWSNDALGWGALTARRPDYCYGDPIRGFDSNGLPEYAMNVLPMTIEAENFDYSPVSGEDRIYNDTTSGNTGGAYRTDENVDIQDCSDDGGYNVGWMKNGEWLTYTVYVPADGEYNIDVRYSTTSSSGKIRFEFNGKDVTGDVLLPNTGSWNAWSSYTVASGVSLSQGVQSMRIYVSCSSSYAFNLNNITISQDSVFDSSQDVGSPSLAGSVTYSDGIYTIEGGGSDIWNDADNFYYVSSDHSDDGEIIARVDSVENTHSWAKAGVMFRESTDDDSKHVSLIVRPDNLVYMQYRGSTGGSSSSIGSFGSSSDVKWIKLVRDGDLFTGYYSTDGDGWTMCSQVTVSMNSSIQAGLAVTSHDDSTLCTAVFSNVSVSDNPMGYFANTADIGDVAASGSFTHVANSYVIGGSGADIWNEADEFYFASQSRSDDASISACVVDVEAVNTWSKAGVMFRDSMNADAIQVSVIVRPDRQVAMQWRSSTGGSSSYSGLVGDTTNMKWVKLVRSGDSFTGYYSTDGSSWTSITSTTVSMGDDAEVGLAVTSHDDGTLCIASMTDVIIE